MTETSLKIEGMTCEHCVRAVRDALLSVEGVQSATVTLEPGQAVVNHEESVSTETLLAAVREEDYEARTLG
jgi:copper chaperone CopZ